MKWKNDTGISITAVKPIFNQKNASDSADNEKEMPKEHNHIKVRKEKRLNARLIGERICFT